MDIGPDVVASTLFKRNTNLASSPTASWDSSCPASSPRSVFSNEYRSSQRSDISSTTSLVGDNGSSEDDVAYYSDSDPQVSAADLETSTASTEESGYYEGIPYPTIHPDRHNDHAPSPRTLLQQKHVVAGRFRLSDLPRSIPKDSPVPLICRQNPRRTQRPSNLQRLDGAGSVEPRPPPQLVRQCERKEIFVDSLVDTTTQTIETIWPLSTAQGRANADQNLIGLRTFVQEVLKRSKTSYSTLLVAIHYLIVVMSALPRYDFTMEQKVDSDACRAMQCGRRMFLAALILASKYLQDRNYSTRAWSKISGLKVAEINNNERVFLDAVNWKLHLPDHLFQKWEKIIFRYSPSSHTASVPRSSPAARQTWRSIVRQLNADLDQFDNNTGMLLSDNDSGYYSETSAGPSRGSSPHAPREYSATAIATPKDSTPFLPTLPISPPLTLEPTPQDSKPDNRMLPPLQPREGLLPTPQITPQIRNFCAPSVSASGLLPRRSSMGIAMTEHRRCLDEKLLDRPSTWSTIKDSRSQSNFSCLRSSLSSDWSSPESVISDISQFPSRASSISSAASSVRAPPESNLATDAMRRYADWRKLALTDGHSISREESVTPTAPLSRIAVAPEIDTKDFYFKERPKRSEPGSESLRQTTTSSIPSNSNSTSTLTDVSADSSVADDEESTPRPRPAGTKAINTPNSQTYQAAAALVDLTVDRSNRPPLHDKAGSLKRGRPISINLGLEHSVRDLLRPHALEQMSSDDDDNAIVVASGPVADTWLSKGNSGSLHHNNAETWAAFNRRQIDSEDQRKSRELAEQMKRQHAHASSPPHNSSSESLPRKRRNLRSSGEATPTPTTGLSVRKGGGNAQPSKAPSKSSNPSKFRNRGSRKPSAEMNQLLRDEYEEMQDPAYKGEGLLYGEMQVY